jgi:hypothetical protein
MGLLACGLWPASAARAKTIFDMSFAPRLDALPAPQKALWPRLKEVPGHFVLYGGTALALRLAHRPSLDFDFFSGDCFVPGRLQSAVPLLKEAEALQIEENTLTVSVMSGEPVKLSFFGGLTLRRVGQAEWTNDHVVRVASQRGGGGAGDTGDSAVGRFFGLGWRHPIKTIFPVAGAAGV